MYAAARNLDGVAGRVLGVGELKARRVVDWTKLQTVAFPFCFEFLHVRHTKDDFDGGAASFIDSAGVGALVSLFVSRRNHPRTFALAGLTQQGMAMVQVAGLAKLLPSFPTIEAAIEAKN